MTIFTGIAASLTALFTGRGLSAGFSAFLIKTGAQIATSFLVRLLQGPQAKPAFGVSGKLQAGDGVPRQFPLGKAMTAGSLVYANEWGEAGKTPNAYFTQVIALSDLPVKGLLAVMVDGVYVTLDATPHADLGYPVLEYRVSGTDYLWVKFYDGTQTTADAHMVATVGDVDRPYESTRVGYGIAYAICHCRTNQTLFSGFPSFRFLLDSVKLYDPSKDTTVGGSGTQRWATPSTWGGDGDYLAAVQAYNLLRGISYSGAWLYGFQGMSEYRVPAADWIAAIGDCRATVTEDDGPQPRYRAGGMLAVDAECGAAIEQIMAACAGRIAESGGIYKPAVGVARSAVASITDGDIITTEEQGLIPFKGLADIINAVAATYPEPEEGFNMKSAPTLFDAGYEALDGDRRLPSTLTLPNVPYGEQVQRLQKAALIEARKERRHSGTLGPEWIGLEPNDVLEWTSTRHGYTAKQFRVDAVLDRPDAHVVVDLVEVDSTDYDWVTASDYTAQDKVPAAISRPGAQSLTGFSVAQATLDVGGNGSQPGISFSWTDADLEDVTGIRYQVRLTSSGVVKARGVTADIDALSFIIPHAFKASTGYEVRARPIAMRETAWTAWTAITTNAATLTSADISGSSVFSDAAFTLQDNADATKQAMFELSSISSGTTRTFTLPNTTGTIVLNNQTTTTLGSTTAAATLNIGAGATISGATKAVNIGTAGVSGSTTNVQIGSAVSGALGATTFNSPTIAFGATVTSITLPDAATFLADSTDPTKKLQFELSGITAGTTRTLTAPNASGTLMLTSTGVTAAQMPALTGDATSSAGAVALTLATVNSNVGSFGLAGSVAQFTVNAKGLITAAANVAISIASTAISDLTTAIMTLAGTQTVTGDKTWTGANLFQDNKFTIRDNTDLTKMVDFDVSGIGAGLTRTFAFPNIGGAAFVVDTGTQNIGGAKTFTGDLTTTDINFFIVDNVDPTKILKFQVNGLSTGTTRTMTVPNISGTIVVDSGAQTIGGVKTLTSPPVFPSYTVAGLPAATLGSRAFVSNSNATLAAGLGNIVAGGGANFVPVYADGTNWRIG